MKPRAGGLWTESRYFSFIRSNLRRAWMKYPVNKAVKAAAMREKQAVDKDGNLVYYKSGKKKGQEKIQKEYECAMCGAWNIGAHVQVDHITPCGSLKSFEDLPRFVETLFCEPDNLRVLCKICHHKVTQEERKRK